MTEVPPEGGSATAGLTVSGLEFAYGDDEPVLRDASLDVPAGRVRALLGPSGCGKTTLLRVVAGLERPRAGSVIGAGGRVLTDTASRTWVDPAERRVAMVFQNWALFPHMTVGENISFAMSREARAHGGRLSETLAMVGLEGLGHRRPAELSGGQQQRVALGRALAQRPEVLLLDEPFSNLDPGLRTRVREEVRELLGSLGITTLLVTHDREEAFLMGDLLTVLRDGAVVADAPPASLYREPPDRWTAEFLGEAIFLRGEARSDGRVETVLGALRVTEAARTPFSGPATVMLRPESLGLSAARGSASAGGSPRSGDPERGCATVQAVSYSGQLTNYDVDLDGQVLKITEIGAPLFSVGDPVVVEGPREPVVLLGALPDV